MLCAVSQKKQNTADKRSTPTSHRVAVVTLGCFDFALQNLAIHKKKKKVWINEALCHMWKKKVHSLWSDWNTSLWSNCTSYVLSHTVGNGIWLKSVCTAESFDLWVISCYIYPEAGRSQMEFSVPVSVPFWGKKKKNILQSYLYNFSIRSQRLTFQLRLTIFFSVLARVHHCHFVSFVCSLYIYLYQSPPVQETI